MNSYRIPHTELVVSRLAYGSMQLGGSWDKAPLGEDHKAQARAVLEAVYQHGINHIDLADIYKMGKADAVVGEALKALPGLREKLVLQQKVGVVLADDPDFGPPGRYDFSFEHVVTSVEAGLKRLGTDYVDLLAFHRPDALAEPEELARAAEHLHKRGMVRYFGVSNHNPAQIELLRAHMDQPLVVNQLELSLLHPYLISDGVAVNQQTPAGNTAGTLEYCQLHGILVQAWSPLASGRLVSPGENARERALAARIAALAEEKRSPREAVALAWLLRHPAGIQPILGTTKLERIAASVLADTLTLDRREWYSLLEAARGARVP